MNCLVLLLNRNGVWLALSQYRTKPLLLTAEPSALMYCHTHGISQQRISKEPAHILVDQILERQYRCIRYLKSATELQ